MKRPISRKEKVNVWSENEGAENGSKAGLAKRTLIDYTTLSRIENDLKAVTLSQAVVIAKALGCRVEDML
ncbi:helix-turn-helix domain-containing protein [Streptococcus pseudopneumoniae]|nr:helix-turn-helix transcriptional regulator [Streptococcus pseudopneumoniae]